MGWIKIHHKFLEWEWFQDDGMVRLFINILLRANFEPKKWKGILVERGQLITGRKKLSLETGLSEQTVRTCVQRLENTGEILQKSTNKFTIITICNYDTYQVEEISTNQQLTNNQPTTNQQRTTTKEYKKERIYKKETSTNVEAKKILSLTPSQNLEKRAKNFGESLIPFMDTYGKEMIRSFYNYWTEPNKSKTKMRFELERTWDVSRRLLTWSSNNFKSNGTKEGSENRRRGFEVNATSPDDYKTSV